MKDPVLQKMASLPQGNYLLGFSGGPDSKFLLHALLLMGHRPHVVHIDHGWREESAAQAEQLCQEVEALGLPFILHRIEKVPKRNVEDAAREERLAFFKKCYEEVGADGLLLAHQKDDLAETVLKRIFEGASLQNLKGMEEEGALRGMRVLRPLLRLSKKEIVNWLEHRGISYIDDPTNRDAHYLRSRMRKEMIPYLEEKFGKGIVDNLVAIGTEAGGIARLLEKKWGDFVEEGGKRMAIAVKDLEGLDPFESKGVLKMWLKCYNIVLSRPLLEEILLMMKRGVGGKKVLFSDGMIYLEKGSIKLELKRESV